MQNLSILRTHDFYYSEDKYTITRVTLQFLIRQLEKIYEEMAAIRRERSYRVDVAWLQQFQDLQNHFGETYAFAVPFATFRVGNYVEAYNCEDVFLEELAALGAFDYDSKEIREIVSDFMRGEPHYHERTELSLVSCRHMIAALKVGLKPQPHDHNLTRVTIGLPFGAVTAVAIDFQPGPRPRGVRWEEGRVSFALKLDDEPPKVLPGFKAEVRVPLGVTTHFALLGVDPNNFDNLQLQETRDGEAQPPIRVYRNQMPQAALSLT